MDEYGGLELHYKLLEGYLERASGQPVTFRMEVAEAGVLAEILTAVLRSRGLMGQTWPEDE